MSVKDQDIDSLKKTLRALLLSTKHGLTLQQLYNDYEMVIGQSVPYAKLGYRSFAELLRSMPDVVKSRRNSSGRELFEGIADPSSVHIASMVSKQRSTKRYCRLKSTQPVISNRLAPKCEKKCPPEVPMNVKIKLRQLLVSYPDGLPLSKFQDAYNKRFGYYLHTSTWGFKNLIEAFQSIDSIITLKCNSSQDDGEYILHIAKPGTKGRSATESLNSLEKSSVVEKHLDFKEMDSPQPLPVEISKQLKELLELHPGGIWASNLSIEFMNYFNEELPFKALGYSSVIEFITTIPDLVDLERPTGTGDWLVFAKGKKQSSPLVKSSLKPVTPIPNGLVNVIFKVLENQLSPVLVDSFPSLFKEVTNRSLPVLEYGYASCLELLKQVPGITIVYQDNSVLVEICKKEEMKIDVEKVEESSSDEKDETLLPSLTEKPVPKPRPSAYLCQAVPQGSKAFGVYVTYVKTPSYFCIQVIGEDSTQALDSLHEDMAQYYNSKAGDKCSIDAPYVGQPCCTRFNNDGYWYRAAVSGFPQPDTVEVTYVDYGNSGVVPKTTLRQPKAHYLALPAQAVECRLANIVPVGGMWSRRAAQLLFQMTKDKAIAAIVTSSKGQYLSLCLCDTTTERDIHINDCLVTQGLALFSPDTVQDQGNVDMYKLEPPPSERSVDEAKIRVPDTVGSAASLIPPTSNSDNSQLSSQNMMLQLMALMHQNSLLLQQPSLLASQAGQHNPLLPSPFTPSYTTNPVSVDHRPKVVRTPPGLGNNRVTEKSYVEKTNSKKVNIKEIQLPSPYTLHLLNYNGHPHAVSKEIASWYWETDLLQYKLHQIPNSPCGLLLYRDKVPELFELLVKSQSPVLWEALASDSITVYPLEDLPAIVQCLNGPWNLYEVLKKLVTEWKQKCVVFWTEEHNVDLRNNIAHEVNVLSKKLKELQEKRTSILSALAKKSSCHESSIGGEHVLDDFLTTDKEIEILEQEIANFNIKTEELNKTTTNQVSFHADKLNFFDTVSSTDLVTSSETFSGHCNELLSQPATVSEVVCNTNSSYPLLSQPVFNNQTTTNIIMGGLTGKVPLNRVRSNSSSLSAKTLNVPTPKSLQSQQPQQFSLSSIPPINKPLLETLPSNENPIPHPLSTKSVPLLKTPSLINVTQKCPPLIKYSHINNHPTVPSTRKTLSVNSPFLNGPPPSANKLPTNCYPPLPPPPPPHLFNPPYFQTHLPPSGGLIGIGRGDKPLLDPSPFTVGMSQPVGLGRGMVRPMGWHTDQNLYPMPLIRPGAGLDVI